MKRMLTIFAMAGVIGGCATAPRVHDRHAVYPTKQTYGEAMATVIEILNSR